MLFFAVCGLAIRYIDDNRIRAVAFFSALIASAGMAGFIKMADIESVLQKVAQTADPVGVGLSGFVMSAGMLSPISQLRRPLLTAGATTLAASLIGIPVWITWMIIFIIIGIIAYLIYRAVVKTIGRFTRGGGNA